jgi:hypothetical protein
MLAGAQIKLAEAESLQLETQLKELQSPPVLQDVVRREELPK